MKTLFRLLLLLAGVLGGIALTVNSTGKVEPIHRVSGPISELFVDYNSKVVEGQLMARIDSRIYKSTVAAQFQTPEMFVVAPEMDKRMHIERKTYGMCGLLKGNS